MRLRIFYIAAYNKILRYGKNENMFYNRKGLNKFKPMPFIVAKSYGTT